MSPVPVTTGQLRSKIEDMQKGDYIVCNYQASSNAVGVFSNLGGTAGTEIPVEGSATPNGSFYFVKVDKGLLIASSVLQHSISWDTLNANRVIQGRSQEFDGVNGIIRSLTGGCAYADENGNQSTTDLGTGLAFPVNNEFDKYILGFDQTKIQSGKTLADVFHHAVVKIWTQDTPIVSIATATNRVARGGTTGTNNFSYLSSSTANTTVGFRPVFEFVEQV